MIGWTRFHLSWTRYGESTIHHDQAQDDAVDKGAKYAKRCADKCSQPPGAGRQSIAFRSRVKCRKTNASEQIIRGLCHRCVGQTNGLLTSTVSESIGADRCFDI